MGLEVYAVTLGGTWLVNHVILKKPAEVTIAWMVFGTVVVAIGSEL